MAFVYQIVSIGSRVLEFGPSTGYLTQQLRDKKECQISIIEIDEDAFNQAIAFAVDGFLGDIESFDWKDMWESKTFDYILFGDVLEHLRNPSAVLKAVKPLLVPKGKLVVTVPNVAHNSIIFNLLKNEFRYNSLGLLDNTHIHLFTYNSICNMLEEVNTMERKVLSGHLYGNVYQFIFTAMLEDLAKVDDMKYKIDEKRQLKLYFDTGHGFSEEQVIKRTMEIGENKFEYIFNYTKPIKNIKIKFGSENFQFIQMNELTRNLL